MQWPPLRLATARIQRRDAAAVAAVAAAIIKITADWTPYQEKS